MIDRIFDVVICLLLLATIVHLALVQHRLRAFRAERDRLQAFVTALDFTVERAETAIRRLRGLEIKASSANTEGARPLPNRAPEDLLRAARLAAGVDGKPGKGQAAVPGQAKAKRAGASAGALKNALGG